jgi:hypothetical protein
MFFNQKHASSPAAKTVASTGVNMAQNNGVNSMGSFEVAGVAVPQLVTKMGNIQGLVQGVEALPLWMKQVLFIVLKTDLDSHLSTKTLNSLSKDNFLQLWQPALSTGGIKALYEGQHPEVAFLQLLKDKKPIYLLCAEQLMTLEQFCTKAIKALDEGLVCKPENRQVLATMEYLGNKTRIGDYLVRLNRISMNDLEDALKTQKYISASSGEQIGIGEILVRLNLVTQQDIESILFLKQQASQAFQLS